MNKDLVSVITCTGHRKDTFKLCYQYMKNQTYKGAIQWIVVNDEYSPEEITSIKDKYSEDFELYAAPILWRKGLNTQRANMSLALQHVKGDKILFFEDDDFYKPAFIKTMAELLDYGAIVGESNSKYYHVGLPGYKENRNYIHSSLCQTGIKKELIPLLIRALNSGNKYFDVELWRLSYENKAKMLLLSEINMCIGMKGLPGRAGIGMGHNSKGYTIDINFNKLKEWLGSSISLYSDFLKVNKYDRNSTPFRNDKLEQPREPESNQPSGKKRGRKPRNSSESASAERSPTA